MTLREAAQQALEAMERIGHAGGVHFSNAAVALRDALAEPVQPELQTCNCRWDGDTQVQQCTLHEAHVDAIHEWAGRAKEAERKLKEQPQKEPVAWMHNLIDDNVITHRPADINRHPDRWTALYSEPKPCPTCEALARTVMLDQTSHDTAPPQRKPLTDDEIVDIWAGVSIGHDDQINIIELARAIEAAHGIGDSNE